MITEDTEEGAEAPSVPPAPSSVFLCDETLVRQRLDVALMSEVVFFRGEKFTCGQTNPPVEVIAGTLGFVSLAVSCFFAAGAMSRRGALPLSRLSLFSGLAVLLGFFGGAAFATTSAGVLGIWFSVVVGWAWLAIVSVHLYRGAPAQTG